MAVECFPLGPRNVWGQGPTRFLGMVPTNITAYAQRLLAHRYDLVLKGHLHSRGRDEYEAILARDPGLCSVIEAKASKSPTNTPEEQEEKDRILLRQASALTTSHELEQTKRVAVSAGRSVERN